MPLPFPDNLTPLSGNLVFLAVNEYWWSVLFGTLDRINDHQYWEVSDEEWVNEVQPAILELMSMPDYCIPICDLTYDETTGKWSWTQGGVPYEANTIEFYFPNTENVLPLGEATDIRDLICGGVFGVTAYFRDLLLEIVIKQIDTLQDLVKLSDWFGSVLTAIPLIEISAIGYNTIADIAEWIAMEALTDARDTLQSISFIDDIREKLYCRILANNNQISEALFLAWVEEDVKEWDDIFGLQREFFSRYFADVFGWKLFQSRYSLYSFDEENDCRLLGWCEEEPEPFTYTEDFDGTETQLDWFISAGMPGVWINQGPGAAQGWTGTAYGGDEYCYVEYDDYRLNGTITEIYSRWGLTGPDNNGCLVGSVNIWLDGSLVYSEGTPLQCKPPGPIVPEKYWYPNITSVGEQTMRIQVIHGNSVPRMHINQIVRIKGTGVFTKP